MPRNDFITTLQTQERPSTFQLALREHAHDLPFINLFGRSTNCSVRMALTDRDTAERTQKRMQKTFVIIFLVDDVTDWTRTGELQDEGVHPSDVIGHQKKASWRQVFQTQRGDPIKAAHKWAAKEVEGALGSGLGRHRL